MTNETVYRGRNGSYVRPAPAQGEICSIMMRALGCTLVQQCIDCGKDYQREDEPDAERCMECEAQND